MAPPDTDDSVRRRGVARVGCSGWSYKDWRGPVYPLDAPPRRWFSLYADQFDTVEINATFYRLPEASTVDGWAAQAPEDFCYSVKVGQFGSHRKKLRDAAEWLPRHLDRACRLGHHLGPNLVQLPPGWKRNIARLEEFFDAAPPDLRWAVEVRDESWLHDDVYDVLKRHDAALCIHDLLADHPWELTASWAYVRFHGPRAIEQPYHGRYGPERLETVALTMERWCDQGVDVFAYFNNDWYGHAVVDARWLRRRLDPQATNASSDGWLPPPNFAPWPDHHRPTEFQQRVVDAAHRLGEGDLVTYADIAGEIGRPGAAQAVANVLRHAPDVPWWRVVPSDGRLYRTHEAAQRPLLEREGHQIDADRRIVDSW